MKNSQPPIIMVPADLKDKGAYLSITLKTIDSGDVIGKLKDELKNTMNSTINFAGDVVGEVVGKVKNAVGAISKEDNKKKTNESLDLQFRNMVERTKKIDHIDGTDRVTFVTYIPADFAVQLSGGWQEDTLFGGINTTVNNLSKIPFAGSLIGKAYNGIKNNVSLATGATITPRQVKLFNPSFFEFDLNFVFDVESEKEANDLTAISKIFTEAMIPKNFHNSEELFQFPAIFTIDINIVDKNSDVSSEQTETQELWDYMTRQTSLGIAKCDLKLLSGDNPDMKFRNGKPLGYSLNLTFTSLRRNYANTSVAERVNSILDKIK